MRVELEVLRRWLPPGAKPGDEGRFARCRRRGAAARLRVDGTACEQTHPVLLAAGDPPRRARPVRAERHGSGCHPLLALRAGPLGARSRLERSLATARSSRISVRTVVAHDQRELGHRCLLRSGPEGQPMAPRSTIHRRTKTSIVRAPVGEVSGNGPSCPAATRRRAGRRLRPPRRGLRDSRPGRCARRRTRALGLLPRRSTSGGRSSPRCDRT